MTSRDGLQIISAAISLATLIIIARKLIHRQGNWRTWLPFIVISAMTLAFYTAVQFGWLGGLSSDLSAMLRLTTQISLLFYAWYMPPGSRP